MPLKDGTGPSGEGPGAGKGRRHRHRRGRAGNAGPGGHCVCPKCGVRVEHKPGIPCSSMNCPTCGIQMVRE
ncbi:hypothetical protein ACFL38_05635 [Candidatus Omnitrophota bacterium]